MTLPIAAQPKSVKPDRKQSWMTKPALAGGALLYVSDAVSGDVNVYSYKGQKIGVMVGQLTGFKQPDGLCSDGKHVWVTNTNNQTVDEYAPGGTAPIDVLQVGNYYPVGCAVDPTSGDLAVTDISSTSNSAGNIAVFADAQGLPNYFHSGNVYYYYFCSYDGSGNLWFDGQANATGTPFAFAELAKGDSIGNAVPLNQVINFPGAVQWDGKSISIGDQLASSGESVAYEFRMSGSTGTRTHVTPFKGSKDVVQFWIDKRTTADFGPDAGAAQVGVYKYAVGGMPIQVQAPFSQPIGATIVR